MAENKNELSVILREHKREIEGVAAKGLNKNRMLSIFLAACDNPRIQECTKTSIVKAAKRMAELGTEIVGAGGAWLVPYRNNEARITTLTVIPDWRLIIRKAREAGVITHATAEIVYEGDTFAYQRGMHPNLEHIPTLEKRGKPRAAYCIYTLPDGTKDFAVMTKDEIDGIKNRSKASAKGPWTTDYEEMAKKTVIRRALKIFEGSSPEFSTVIDADNEGSGIDLDPEPIREPQAIENKPKAKPAAKKTAAKETAKTDAQPEGGKSDNPFVKQCADCEAAIDSRVADYSLQHHGRTLCRDCQKADKKAA